MLNKTIGQRIIDAQDELDSAYKEAIEATAQTNDRWLRNLLREASNRIDGARAALENAQERDSKLHQ